MSKCDNCSLEGKCESTEKYLKELNMELLGELPMCKSLADVSKEGTRLYSEDIDKTIDSITGKIIELAR